MMLIPPCSHGRPYISSSDRNAFRCTKMQKRPNSDTRLSSPTSAPLLCARTGSVRGSTKVSLAFTRRGEPFTLRPAPTPMLRAGWTRCAEKLASKTIRISPTLPCYRRSREVEPCTALLACPKIVNRQAHQTGSLGTCIEYTALGLLRSGQAPPSFSTLAPKQAHIPTFQMDPAMRVLLKRSRRGRRDRGRHILRSSLEIISMSKPWQTRLVVSILDSSSRTRRGPSLKEIYCFSRLEQGFDSGREYGWCCDRST